MMLEGKANSPIGEWNTPYTPRTLGVKHYTSLWLSIDTINSWGYTWIADYVADRCGYGCPKGIRFGEIPSTIREVTNSLSQIILNGAEWLRTQLLSLYNLSYYFILTKTKDEIITQKN